MMQEYKIMYRIYFLNQPWSYIELYVFAYSYVEQSYQ